MSLLYFDRASSVAANHYRFTTWFAISDAPLGPTISNFASRAPTENESWMTRGGNSYFFFSADVKSMQSIHVHAGSWIDVWFPFVLNPDKKYSLTIGYTDLPIGPIEGTLKDNTLHFVLPAFSVKPGAHLMGEIEGNPDGL